MEGSVVVTKQIEDLSIAGRLHKYCIFYLKVWQHKLTDRHPEYRLVQMGVHLKDLRYAMLNARTVVQCR